MGNSRVTAKNLTILDVRPDENVLVLKGSVPGSKNGLLLIHTLR
jgi:large subunit ribosomal protein L3